MYILGDLIFFFKYNTLLFKNVGSVTFFNPLRIQQIHQTQNLKQKKVEHVIYPWKAEILVISTM